MTDEALSLAERLDYLASEIKASKVSSLALSTFANSLAEESAKAAALLRQMAAPGWRTQADLVCASMEACLPFLREIQSHCGPGEYDEIIARAEQNAKAYRAAAPETTDEGGGAPP